MAQRIHHCFLVAVIFIVSGCTSLPSRASSATILDYQRQVAYLEGRLSNFESGLGEVIEGLGDLTVRSSNIVGGIEEVITLFDEYQRRVDELISLYRSLTDKAEGED